MTTQTEALKLALEGGGLYEITGRIDDIDKCIVHRSVIKEALAQPEQEPVAWHEGESVYWYTSPDLNDWIRANGKPLYTTPPQRKPLTDAQADSIINGLRTCTHLDSKREFLKTWLRDWAAHGIKGDA